MDRNYPTRAVSVALRDGDAFLLIKRARPPAKGLYAFPGGRVDPGETPSEAAAREVMEETGLEISELRFFEEIAVEGDDESFLLGVFLARISGGAARAGDDAEEIGWYRPDQMRDMPVTQSTLEIARRIIENGH
jgi:8-oxo-dGTP diphosphatase